MMSDETITVDEATRMVHEILSMSIQEIIPKEDALIAIKKIPYYYDILKKDN